MQILKVKGSSIYCRKRGFSNLSAASIIVIEQDAARWASEIAFVCRKYAIRPSPVFFSTAPP